MKTWLAVAYGVVCGLLGAGIIFLVSSQPRGEAVKLMPPPTPAPVVIHIAGAVVSPGVYTLPRGSRIKDAIQAAGGCLPDGNEQGLNLASLLKDGERILVGFKSQNAASGARDGAITIEPVPNTGETGEGSPLSNLVNINTASQAELESLPEIGPATAKKIIAYREANGYFSAIEDIQNVSGIGPATFERISELITVEGP